MDIQNAVPLAPAQVTAPQELWDQLADSLEARLLAQPQALALHFLKTATPEQLAEVAGDSLPSTDNTRAGVIAHLSARIEWSSVRS
ncbi:hypothetical protein [Stenotrophomonas oahuensis]|uniref:Uncharacterized protein n=1 Tax=Stenotrophomonas oahuensis TaxID=3003271 RepID=A0ABY9YXA9_9GAMM|nr:hypothetical protein [Stenotrophomonas sp. A5586]WNH54809.1 hypothetical protein PDM29_20915 [Stenotrophomonas sp. A5586]